MKSLIRVAFVMAIVANGLLLSGCGKEENTVIQPAQAYEPTAEEKKNKEAADKAAEESDEKTGFQGGN